MFNLLKKLAERMVPQLHYFHVNLHSFSYPVLAYFFLQEPLNPRY